MQYHAPLQLLCYLKLEVASNDLAALEGTRCEKLLDSSSSLSQHQYDNPDKRGNE